MKRPKSDGQELEYSEYWLYPPIANLTSIPTPPTFQRGEREVRSAKREGQLPGCGRVSRQASFMRGQELPATTHRLPS